MKGMEDEFVPKFSFFQFKKCRVYDSMNQSYKFMLCFSDISQKILYDTSKAEGELLSLINSTISHEMRNPLNSIINQCTIMESLLHSKGD
jgi:signal transduction histidine kinase